MIEFYPQIRHVHILTVVLSGSLFALRGLFALAGALWPHVAPVRYLSYTIDTTLLPAALMLVSILLGALFANGWLAANLVLVVVYVALRVLAMTRGRPPGLSGGSYISAPLLFACGIRVLWATAVLPSVVLLCI